VCYHHIFQYFGWIAYIVGKSLPKRVSTIMERGSTLDGGNNCDVNEYSKIPRLVCSLILCTTPIPSSKAVSCYDNIEYEFTPFSFEIGFMRQNLHKGNRSIGSMSLGNSRQSVQSIGNHMTNHTASTGDTATSPSLKRNRFLSSTSSLTSSQIHQSNNSISTSRPTAAFALPSNPLGSTQRLHFKSICLCQRVISEYWYIKS